MLQPEESLTRRRIYRRRIPVRKRKRTSDYKTYPALVPMEVREWYAKELQGLSLRNVSAAVYDGKKKLYEDFGEMLFTHYGVSGPLMLSASSVIGKRLSEKELRLVIDLNLL